jgi:hypothetical protein
MRNDMTHFAMVSTVLVATGLLVWLLLWALPTAPKKPPPLADRLFFLAFCSAGLTVTWSTCYFALDSGLIYSLPHRGVGRTQLFYATTSSFWGEIFFLYMIGIGFLTGVLRVLFPWVSRG